MYIIIVGCGKVGYTLAQQLSNENHEVAVIDQKAQRISEVTSAVDCMGIVGDGVSHEAQISAGLEKADLLIAVTTSDEENLLCCVIAKKAGHCKTIARVRRIVYHSELDFFKRELGIGMIINPDLTSAQEIARILQFPSAIRVDSFAKGHVELFHFLISTNSPLLGIKLSKLRTSFHSNVLVCTVIRNEQLIIPNGDFEFEAGDMAAITATPSEARAFFKKIKLTQNSVENVLIAGGSRISYYLTNRLQNPA